MEFFVPISMLKCISHFIILSFPFPSSVDPVDKVTTKETRDFFSVNLVNNSYNVLFLVFIWERSRTRFFSALLFYNRMFYFNDATCVYLVCWEKERKRKK